MQINSINNAQSFGMAYKVGQKAGKAIVDAAANNQDTIIKLKTLQDMFGNVSDTLQISKPEKSKGKLLLTLTRAGFDKPETLTVTPRKFVKNPIKYASELAENMYKTQFSSKNVEVIKNMAEDATKDVG